MKWLLPLLFCVQVISAATYTVTDYGAVGDVTATTVTTTSGSYNAVTASGLGAGAIGKIISIKYAGAVTTGANRQDLVAQITNVSGTTISLNRPALSSTNSTTAIYATCSSTGIQAAINLAGNGDIVSIPAGNYLAIPPVWNTNWLLGSTRFAEAAVYVRKGGIRIVGSGSPTLTGNGAFQLTGDGSVYRGYIFRLWGTFTNDWDKTLTFDGITLDGGVTQGRTLNQGFPASPTTGDGWDVTHGALLVHGDGGPPFGTNNLFLNLTLQHWRGEMIKSAYDFVTGDLYNITNCTFIDGNASGDNIQYSGAVVSCCFTNMIIAMENSLGGNRPFYFLNNTMTNVGQGITIQGGLTNRLPFPVCLIQSNVVQTTASPFQVGPSQNVIFNGNYLHDCGQGFFIGSVGGQGALNISNVVIINNVISNSESAIIVYDGSSLCVTNNFHHGFGGNAHFADGISGNGRMFFVNNMAVSVRDGLEWVANVIQWPLDDPSNVFPYHQIDDFAGVTNAITYGYGYRQDVHTAQAGSRWYLLATNIIPPRARMLVKNTTGGATTLYQDQAASSAFGSLANNASQNFYWYGSFWSTNPSLSIISSNLDISGTLIIGQ